MRAAGSVSRVTELSYSDVRLRGGSLGALLLLTFTGLSWRSKALLTLLKPLLLTFTVTVYFFSFIVSVSLLDDRCVFFNCMVNGFQLHVQSVRLRL